MVNLAIALCSLILTASTVNATPNITPNIISASASATTVTVTGSGFGARDAAPGYWSKFDEETTGEMPENQVTNLNSWGTVESNIYRGKKSLEFNYQATAGVNQGDWARNAIDLGTSGSNFIFLSFWLYIDKGNSTSTSWQWKASTFTSCSDMYGCKQPLSPFVEYSSFYSNNFRWVGGGHPMVYTGNQAYSMVVGAPSDAYLWNQWQRIDLYVQRSSVDGVADGKVYENRIGRASPIVEKNDVITHREGDNNWRYVVLSHAIESVMDGFVNLKVYMDDVYVDVTRARVELCESATWSARTHCEIQPSSAWSDTGVTATLNSGIFSVGATPYLYIVDAEGAVNENGYQITVSGAQRYAVRTVINEQRPSAEMVAESREVEP